MINYYKILGVENYAEIEVVKAAYKDKIRQYHPDLHPDKESEEIAKYLNRAKTELTDPVLKTAYDRKLKLAYLVEIHQLQSRKNNQQLWYERKKNKEEAQKIKEKERYERSLRYMPFSIRLGFSIAFMLTGLQLIYSNYFIMYRGIELLYCIAGFALFVASTVQLSNLLFTHYWVRSMSRVIRFNYEKWIARMLVVVLLSGPLSIFALNEYRKSYQLSNHYDYYLATIDRKASKKGDLVYTYVVDGKRYGKRIKLSEGPFIMLDQRKILIKYSVSDPRIADVVKDQNEIQNLLD